jgi:hypothetical protein
MKILLAISLISFSLFVHSADHFGQWNDDVDAALAATGGLVQLIGDFVAERGAEFIAHLDEGNEQHFAECTIL